jgi:asparagine synthase (glutamine-hydrolysing)
MYVEPFADSSQIPTSIISKYASTKVKVILSGDGADEYFCGYNRYLGIKKITKFFEVLPFKIRFLVGQILIRVPNFIVNIIFLILKRINNSNFELNQINEKIYKLSLVLINCKTIEDIYILILKNYFDGKDILVESNVDVNLEKVILKYIEPQSSSVKNMMLIDQNFYLPNDILNKVDRASMFYSLETRVPFLNKDVIDFSNHLPLKFKIRGNNTKWILKELLKKYIPEKYVNRPKMGFSIPLNTWLRGPLKNWSSQNLQFDDDNLVNQNYINLIMNNHYEGKSDISYILCILIVWNLCKKKYLY